MAVESVLFSHSQGVFRELPLGKIGKDGERVRQEAQKGNTCFFYALKRILSEGQTRSEHGRFCSGRRKAITAAGSVFSSPMQEFQARQSANKDFLSSLGMDPQQAAHDFLFTSLDQALAEVPGESRTKEMIEGAINEIHSSCPEQKPWYWLEVIDNAAKQHMAEGYGLKEVSCACLMTIDSLIATLRGKGALVVGGKFGARFYGDVPATKLSAKVGSHALYAWKKGTPRTEVVGGHAIVLVGAEKKNNRSYVYWVDPNDLSDPQNEESQRIYVSSFEVFKSRLGTLRGFPIEQLSSQSVNIMGGAFYNPVQRG